MRPRSETDRLARPRAGALEQAAADQRRRRPPSRRSPSAAARARLAARRVVRQRRPQVPVDGPRGHACSCSSTPTRIARSRRASACRTRCPTTRCWSPSALDEVRVTRARARGGGCAVRRARARRASTSICAARATASVAITPDMIQLPSGLQSRRSARARCASRSIAASRSSSRSRRSSPGARCTATSCPRSKPAPATSRSAAPRARSRALSAVRTREVSRRGPRRELHGARPRSIPPDGVETVGGAAGRRPGHASTRSS